MFQIFFIFFMLIWPAYYAKIAPDYNNTERYLIAGGYEPEIQTHAKYTVSIANLRKFDPNNNRTFDEGHFCAGSIIGIQTILTAAHCVKNKNPDNLVVIAGTPIRTKKVRSMQILHVKSILAHPKFNARIDSPHDIAVLQLRDKIIEDHKTAQRIQLATTPYTNPGERCLHVGWGLNNDKGDLSNVLQYVHLVVFGQNLCDDILGFTIEKTFCAGDPERKIRAGCKGDSGGPLFCKGQLYGIDVISVNCSKSLPTHFTEVSKYLDWIQKNSLDYLNYKSAAQKNLAGNIFFNIFIIYLLCLAKIG